MKRDEHVVKETLSYRFPGGDADHAILVQHGLGAHGGIYDPWCGSLALADPPTTDAVYPRLRRLSASDIETATDALSEADCDVTVLPTRTDTQLQNLTIARLGVSSLSVRCGHLPLITVCLPIAGEAVISSKGCSARVGSQSAVVVPSAGPVAVDYLSEDSRVETIVFEQATVEAELARMMGVSLRKPLRFDMQFSWPEMTPFSRALSLLRYELTSPDGIAAVPEMSARLGHLVIAGLLISLPHNYTEELTKPKTVPVSRPIRNALEFIESRSAEIGTVADIAASVGLSVRALDDGFRRYVGMPPMTYLREVRMVRAHAELLASEPEMTTATAVARKWGFGHYGRFAADYRRRFGCKPSETLRGR
jgi:AraC-like DNA-binding protein